MLNVDRTIDGLIGREGAYSDNPKDRGGETMWGVTEAVARRNGYAGPMKDMQRAVAFAIFKKEYWIKPGWDVVAAIFPALAEKLFDIGVNMGVVFAGITLQRCLNVLNRQGRDFADLVKDGNCGPATMKALKSYLEKRSGGQGVKTLLFMVAAQQSARYVELAEMRPDNEEFQQGWQEHRAIYNALP